jgi:nucleoside-diphosphate-sugar epimerase
MRLMHVLLTGATGFIGGHLLRRLLRDGHRVSCLVRAGKRDVVEAAGGRAVVGDLVEAATLKDLPADADAVVHLVGGGRVSTVGEAGLAGLLRLNVTTTRNLLEALPRPPSKVILFSSVSAQGIRDGEVIREDTPCTPGSPHEIAKRDSELAAELWCARHEVPLAILRPAQVYGPGDTRSEIPAMLRLVRLGLFPVFGAGDNLMVPMIHVADVVELTVRALALPMQGIRHFNLTGPQSSVLQTARICSQVVGRARGWVHVPKAPARLAAATMEAVCKTAGSQPPLSRVRIDNMTAHRVYDSTRTLHALGDPPLRDLASGIRETYAWYLATGTGGLEKSVANLLPLALAEGEGVGTAYEYLAKWRAIRTTLPGVRRMLIAGLPEKYGSSLDFVDLAAALDAELLVIDEREEALSKLREAMLRAQLSPRVSFRCMAFESLADLSASSFDIALSCEVLQRLDDDGRTRFVRNLVRVAGRVALFAPNADNGAHATRSGLKAITLGDLHGVLRASGAAIERSGFVDMPPFPPGLTLSKEKRAQVKQSRFQSLALDVLGLYGRAEPVAPPTLKRRLAHIVFAVAHADPNAVTRV